MSGTPMKGAPMAAHNGTSPLSPICVLSIFPLPSQPGMRRPPRSLTFHFVPEGSEVSFGCLTPPGTSRFPSPLFNSLDDTRSRFVVWRCRASTDELL